MLVTAKANVNEFKKETVYFAVEKNGVYTVKNGNKSVSYVENVFNKYFQK